MRDELVQRLRDAPGLRRVAARYAIGRPLEPRAVTRFAPSPTGELHLGHVAHALWVWGVAIHLDAQVLIRMEDHDRTRCRPEHERSILDDLDWLGFEGDAVSRNSLETSGSEFRQSDVPRIYQEAFDRLAKAAQVYGCTCTRGDFDPPGADGERRYHGTCRGILVDVEGKHVVRVRLPDRQIQFVDLRQGAQSQRPQEQCGDMVVLDALGQWSYQFSVVVDDMRHGVNLIVRGDDLLSSTGRQLLLADLLGRRDPLLTVHHPLVVATDGQKLSKRDASESLRFMRERGRGADEIIQAAWLRAGLDS